MGAHKSEATRQTEFGTAADGMYVRLRHWRAEHLDASFDEIGVQVTRERKALMSLLLGELAAQPEEAATSVKGLCPECGQELSAKGKHCRVVSHLEGDVELERDYHYCGTCHSGLFPPGRQAETDEPCVESADDRPSLVAECGDSLV